MQFPGVYFFQLLRRNVGKSCHFYAFLSQNYFFYTFFLEENQLKWRIALEYSKKEKKDELYSCVSM